MKFTWMAKTVAILLGAFGAKELPVDAETKKVNLSAEQEAIAQKVLGTTYQEAIDAINKEILEMADGNLELKAIQDELDAFQKQKALLQGENASEVNRDVAATDGKKPSIEMQIADLRKEYNDMFAKLVNEGVGDQGKVIQITKANQRMQHSTTHLHGSGLEVDAFENRPWNQRAAGTKAGVSNFNDTVDVPILNGDTEHFIRQNPKVLESIFSDITGLPSEWSKETGIIDRVMSGVVGASEITQGNQDGWNPKGKLLIETEEGQVFQKKVDITLRGYELKKMETMWINWLNGNDGSHPWKTTFVGFILSEYMKQQMLDSRIAQINGIYAKTPDGNNLAGANINTQNGLRWLWWYYGDVLQKYKKSDIGAPTPSNIVDHIEKLILTIPEHKRNLQGYEIQLSHTVLKMYRERAGEQLVHNYNTDSGKYEYKESYPVDRPNFKFQPLLDQTNTLFIGITMSKNVQILDFKENEKGEYTLTHDKRDTHVFMDFREGIRFIQVGRKLAEGDPKEFEYQMLYSNAMPVFGSDVKVPLFDDETGIIKLKYPQYYPHFRIVEKDFATDITNVEGVEAGMVVTITGNKQMVASKKVKRNANLLLDTADFNLNTGGTLTLLVQADRKLKELSRTTAPEAAPETSRSFATPVVDVNEGVDFKFNGSITTAITNIINGVEGKQVTIYGTDTVGVDVTLATTTAIKLDSAITLGTSQHYIILKLVNSVWYEVARLTA
jgi:hypothetical protein